MIHQFFGLREQPFGVTPDPRYLYLGRGHREALASMYYGIQANRGFLALIANPGMGKTTLLFHLLEKFRHSDRTAFLFQTQCSSRDFMRLLLAELDVPINEEDPVKIHEQFNRYLLEQSAAGRRVIIVIDEAQNLDLSVMETVRLLSNFETPRSKLLQIILSGQAELATKLASIPLSQLRQRIASFSSLDSLNAEEVSRFIDHRLHVARYEGPPLFNEAAKVLVARLSEGIPRNINALCFGALSLACALRQKTIDAEMVQEVFCDRSLEKLLPGSHSVTVPVESNSWSSNFAGATPARSLRPLLNPARKKLEPKSIVTVTSSEVFPKSQDEGGNSQRVKPVEESRLANPSETKVRQLVRSLVPRLLAFAVIVLAVGNGATRVAAPFAKNLAVPEGVSATFADHKITAAEGETLTHTARRDSVSSLSADTKHKSVSQPVKEVVSSALLNTTSTTDSGQETVNLSKTKLEQTSTDDPAELWQRIKEGSTSAEVKLAALYLEGTMVEQDCKQAHLLLLVASKKGSRAADGLLNNEYVERCHE